ncbi:hypothetical protein NUH30_02835 [Leptospira sp. 85282-16]|uniref:hypothetical protein n=1 Tax=Leptospira sp. 85282-16 TaxID=2971256 RepID=UPI0021BF1675|nr:hypothetical protein [Leptospira sp. 85282-16]MCT8332600.1 hypothetical protein [Leptospira sp. 85282-16]
MNSLIYNYFSNLDEWNDYVKGNWKGKGISMIPSTIQPYESGDETTVIWKANSKEIKSHFKRGKSEFSLTWNIESEVLCDRIKLLAKDADWECEIQAMTKDRFHLHVLPKSDKSKILYSGVVTKKTGLFSFL